MKRTVKRFVSLFITALIICLSAAVVGTAAPATAELSFTPLVLTGKQNHIEVLYLEIQGKENYYKGFGSATETIIIYEYDDALNGWKTIFSFTPETLTSASTAPSWAVNNEDKTMVYLDLNYSFDSEKKYSIEICAGAFKTADLKENKAVTADYTGSEINSLIRNEPDYKDKWIDRLDPEKDWLLLFILNNSDALGEFFAKITEFFFKILELFYI